MNEKLSEKEVARRRNEAVRRALNTHPKPYKAMKERKGKKKRQDHPTAFEKRT